MDPVERWLKKGLDLHHENMNAAFLWFHYYMWYTSIKHKQSSQCSGGTGEGCNCLYAELITSSWGQQPSWEWLKSREQAIQIVQPQDVPYEMAPSENVQWNIYFILEWRYEFKNYTEKTKDIRNFPGDKWWLVYTADNFTVSCLERVGVLMSHNPVDFTAC
jgi:hypothetical protein